MTITDLNDRRRAAAETGYDGLVCACGEAWFSLGPDGAVVLDADGAVSGYAGVPCCRSCGAAVTLP
jgi:hypothetical protein